MITISAQQARDLVQRSVIFIERRISEGITKAANNGDSELKITIYDNDFDMDPVIDDLERLGFVCEITPSTISVVTSTSSSMPNNNNGKPVYHYDRDRQQHYMDQGPLPPNDMPMSNNFSNPPAIANNHAYYYDNQEEEQEGPPMANNSSYPYNSNDPNNMSTNTKTQAVRILWVKW